MLTPKRSKGDILFCCRTSSSVRYTLSGMLVSEVSRVVKYLKTSNNILKNDINEVIYKTETRLHRLKKKNKKHGYQRGNVEEGINMDLGIKVHTTYINGLPTRIYCTTQKLLILCNNLHGKRI